MRFNFFDVVFYIDSHISIYIICMCLAIHLFERVIEKGERHTDLPSTDSVAKRTQGPGLKQAKSRGQEQHLSLVSGWQKSKHSNNLSLMSLASSESWVRSTAAGIQTGPNKGYWWYRWLKQLHNSGC